MSCLHCRHNRLTIILDRHFEPHFSLKPMDQKGLYWLINTTCLTQWVVYTTVLRAERQDSNAKNSYFVSS